MKNLFYTIVAGVLFLPVLASATYAPTTEARADARNDRCARIAVAAKQNQAINPEDPALQNCIQGSRTVCERTRSVVEESPANAGKSLIPQCLGPQEMAAGGLETALNYCKIGMFVLNCMANGLPTTPTLNNINTSVTRPQIIRIEPMAPGIQ